MKKKAKKVESSVVETGLEVIGVNIGGKTKATFEGLGGTFACFSDSCIRKQVLPGFHEKDLVVEAAPKGAGLALCLSGKRSAAKLKEIMDIALVNVGAYPETEGKAEFLIEVKSEK